MRLLSITYSLGRAFITFVMFLSSHVMYDLGYTFDSMISDGDL